MPSRPGHEQFTRPSQPNQRRYEALRAYFVEGASAAEVAQRLRYTRASVETLVRDYRKGRLGELFIAPRPGPKRQPKKDAARARVIELRQQRHGIEEIVAELARVGTPLARTAVWEMLREEGLSRMPKPPAAPDPGPEPEPSAHRAESPRAQGRGLAPGGARRADPARRAVLAHPRPGRAGPPGSGQGGGMAVHQPAVGDPLGAVAAGAQALRPPPPQPRHKGVVHDPALGLFAGLSVLPKTWHLTTYSYRTRRSQQVSFFEALQSRLREAGLLGELGLNLDFHAIMSYGEDTVLDKHYVPRRSQRTRSVLTFIAQDGQQHTIIYANAELTARQQAGEVIAFCRFYERTHGQLPKLLVFDQKLTTQAHLAELDELGVGFITLRQRSPKLIAKLEALPASAWTKTRLDRAGKHKTATYHEDQVTLSDRSFRQLAVQGLGREHATLILTNQHQLTPKQLIERYGKRWGIENQLSEQIRAFHLDSLSSQVPLSVDFDVALTVLADTVYRRFARGLHAAYHNQTPDTIREYLINGIGELHLTPDNIEIRLRRRTHTPALLDAGYQTRSVKIPWWGGRTVSYSFPAR